jgi:flavin-dependent dehydrogenase
VAHSYDVCVLGAGPAALSVAPRLVDLGREVAVVDRSVTVRPWGGESFTAAIRAPLAALGLWEAFAEAGHVRGYERQVAWGGDPVSESTIVQPGGHMWHVDRMRFDTDFCRAVCRRDGVFLYRGKLRNIDRSATSWRLALDQGAELTARYLVDATGRSRALAKRLGARISFHDRLIGLVTMGPADSGSFRVAAMMIQSTPFGWWYAAPVPRGRVVALFTDADLAPPVVRQHLRPVPANSVFTDVPVEAGWLAVGDACVAHDPLCGWGVQRAMSNGILAADAINDHLRTGRVSSLPAYRDHCRQQFEDYLAGMARHYGKERRWPGAPFWARRIKGAGAEKES